MDFVLTEQLNRGLPGRGGEHPVRAVELVRARNIAVPDAPLARIANDAGAPDRLRATALGVLVVRNPQLSDAQFGFLVSHLDAKADAVLRQTSAQAIGRSTPTKAQFLKLAHEYLPQADPLTLSTLLECFRKSNDPEVGTAMIAVLQKSTAALGSLGNSSPAGSGSPMSRSGPASRRRGHVAAPTSASDGATEIVTS